jgi:AMMECR1 domain-containing protein
MADLSARARELAARWRDAVRVRPGEGSDLASVLSWIRTIALEDDVLYLDTPRAPGAAVGAAWRGRPSGYLRFGFPSLPTGRPEPVTDPDARARVRFVLRTRAGRGGPAETDDLPTNGSEPGWRAILNLRELVVIERDAPHGGQWPLRLGLGVEEGARVLAHARTAVQRFTTGEKLDALALRAEHPRFAQCSAVAVALWTRGRLRGSVITPPGPVFRTLGQAAVAACQDTRFARLSAADLADTVFQVGFLHPPRVPLSRHEIATCAAYPDKAMLLSDGTRAGAYMPEVFNLFPQRIARLKALTESLARDKMGLPSLAPSARVEVSEVSEVVESADRSRAIRLDGPVARFDVGATSDAVQSAGQAACRWLAAIQGEDGALPLFVRPSSGKAEGTDVVRSAMTAEALAAFGVAYGLDSAVETARRVLGWLDRGRSGWTQKRAIGLPTTIYCGKAAAWLGDEVGLGAAARSALEQLDGPDPGPLVLAHAASFLDRAGARHAPAGHKCESLRRQLAARFARATATEEPVSLAEWAELGAAFPIDSKTSREVRDWLRSRQLPSGAFPESTTSDFVYSRGTGKIFEVLALHPTEAPGAVDRALAWLLSMQYRPDSAFFVPHEHWACVLGGLRHDHYGPDAWIDAAGHFLLGLARLQAR